MTGSSGRVDTITANRERWLATTTDDELDLQPVGRAEILCSLVLILVATLVGHLIPLVALVWLPRSSALVVAIVLSALVLFGSGSTRPSRLARRGIIPTTPEAVNRLWCAALGSRFYGGRRR